MKKVLERSKQCFYELNNCYYACTIVYAKDECTITPKQFTPSTKIKHSFLVFSILDRLIILVVFNLNTFYYFFSPFVISSMLTFTPDNIQFSYILIFFF